MKALLPVVTLLVSLSLTACGKVEAGDDCAPDNSATCSSTSEALWCENGKLRAIPCSGPSGCTETNGGLTCDFSRAQAGDACPATSENKGQCAVGNPDEALRCTSGTWTAVTCQGCSVQNGQITCIP